MFQAVKCALFSVLLVAVAENVTAQSNYRVISVSEAGKITGTVKWSGPVPRSLIIPITKDTQICDPESAKTCDLERMIIGPQGGVANTVVFIRNITAGKPMDLNPTSSARFTWGT